MNRELVQRWSTDGRVSSWGILESGRFYPFSEYKDEAERTFNAFFNKPDDFLREEGYIQSNVLYLDKDPKIEQAKIEKWEKEQAKHLLDLDALEAKSVEEKVQAKAIQNVSYLQVLQQLTTTFGFNAAELFGNANFPVVASTAPVTQSQKEVPSLVVAATSEGRLFREDDE